MNVLFKFYHVPKNRKAYQNDRLVIKMIGFIFLTNKFFLEKQTKIMFCIFLKAFFSLKRSFSYIILTSKLKLNDLILNVFKINYN